MENKFIKFWKKYGPYFLIGSGIAITITSESWGTGGLLFTLGLILMTEND
jgi:hypothetical protein